MLLVAVHSLCAVAQDQPTRLVTVQEAIDGALRNNHDLVAARMDVAKADALVSEARGYALPSLDVKGTYTRAIKKPVFFFPNIFDEDSSKRSEILPIEIGADNSFDLTLSATQVLFNMAVFTGVGAAKVYSQAAHELYRAKIVETVTSTRRTFYGVLVAREVRAMTSANVKNAEENLQNVKILARQGLASEYDQLRAEVGAANIRPELIRADNDYTLALNNLKIAMGIPFDERIEVSGELQFLPVDPGILHDALEAVTIHNPSLAALRKQAELSEAAMNVERANFYPTLAAFGNYQYQAQKNSWKISTADFVRSAVVGLSFSLNIFNGLRTVSRIEQAELDSRKIQQQIAGTETNLRTATQSVLMQLKRAEERIEAQERTVEQAEKGYRIATVRYTSGAGTQLEVNDAQLALTQAKVNRIQALYDYVNAAAELDRLLGRLPGHVTLEVD
jgi:outer membrane protein